MIIFTVFFLIVAIWLSSQVGSVTQTQNGNPVKFAKRTQLVVDSYQVV